MRHAGLTLALLSLLVGACAPTNSTGSLPAEALVALDSTATGAALVLVPLDSTSQHVRIPLDGLPFVPRVLGSRGTLAIVAGSQPITGAAIVDLAARQVLGTIELQLGVVRDVTIPDGSAAFVAIASSELLTRIDLEGGPVTLVPAPGGAQGVVAARGKVYAVIGNRIGCTPEICDRGPSWLIQVKAGLPRDSIPLSGEGNAGPAVIGPDGLLYVISAGAPLGGGEARLSVVDPVRNLELASFAGIGPAFPSWLASDGGERVLMVSPAGGLMVFNTRERRFVLPFTEGIPLDLPSGLVTDARGQAYVPVRTGCGTSELGQIRVFGTDLVERGSIRVGSCLVGASIAEVPADALFGTP